MHRTQYRTGTFRETKDALNIGCSYHTGSQHYGTWKIPFPIDWNNVIVANPVLGVQISCTSRHCCISDCLVSCGGRSRQATMQQCQYSHRHDPRRMLSLHASDSAFYGKSTQLGIGSALPCSLRILQFIPQPQSLLLVPRETQQG
jgi:hypothetical protein